MRQVVLDTETTGLEVRQGHRLVEIACVELVERRLTGRYYQTYLNPGRPMDEGARHPERSNDLWHPVSLPVLTWAVLRESPA